MNLARRNGSGAFADLTGDRMSRKEEDTEEGPRNFGVFLTNLDGGDAVIALSAEQHRLMTVLATEAERIQGTVKGKLTLTLDFKVEHNGVVGVNYAIARKEPAPARGGSVFFMSKGNNLMVENPRQKKLPFDVARQAEDARDPLAATERTAPRGV